MSTYQQFEKITFKQVLEMLATEGLDASNNALTFLLNSAMSLERQRHLNAEPYERCDERSGQANGFKPKTIKSRLGELSLAIPQVRDSSFYPQSIEKGMRSERALRLALAEMYVQGVSTRKVTDIVEKMCGFDVSSSQVSNLAKELDESLEAWRNRPLGRFKYVYLDARYEKVRSAGIVIDCAVLIAAGVNPFGRREILGASVSLSEAEIHWRNFLKQLQERGLHGMELFISDDHPGLKAARQAIFPSVPWQRCQFHLQQNAQRYVPKKDMKEQVAADIRAVFNAPDRIEADRLLRKVIANYDKSAPSLAKWMDENLAEGLVVFSFPSQHRLKIRTVNIVERLNREIRRRTSVATLFPNEASCLRLISAVIMEISEEWLIERNIYLPVL
jgi:transposase-like protein